jgi:hypothetical protein
MWNMRIDFAAALIGVLVAGAVSSVVVAQQQPKPFPWENNANKFLNRGVPKIENPIDKRINQGLKSLGLPTQPQLDTTKNAKPLPEPPGLSEAVIPRLDSNRDGVVSRDEYFTGRRRPATTGTEGTNQHVRRMQRLNSRFRAADRNRDGRLSGTEIDAMKGRRF